jgi:hypothetical protein
MGSEGLAAVADTRRRCHASLKPRGLEALSRVGFKVLGLESRGVDRTRFRAAVLRAEPHNPSGARADSRRSPSQ